MSELCLTLLCPPEIEEKLLDRLLLRPEVQIFTSAPTAAHGLGAGALTAKEQVLGRAHITQVQALLLAKDLEMLLGAIKREFAGTGLRYWVSTLSEAGEIA